jgi:anion-transporting ATPase
VASERHRSRVQALCCWRIKAGAYLLVSTDPASNLDAVLGTTLANSPTAVAGVPNLQAMNIDPEQATREYRERTVGPYRSILPRQELKLLEERLSGACTVEVAAFDEFALLLSDPERTQEFDARAQSCETADIALMTDDISRLPWLVRHSRRTLAIIRQNITFALAIKAVFVVLTLLEWRACGLQSLPTPERRCWSY